jgi:hypothetical protein
VAYAGRAFSLSDDTGRITLTHKETDLAGDDVRLIYTGRVNLPAKSLMVDSNLFEESHPEQENQVNVRRAKVTKTAVFRPGAEPQRISFD